MACPALQNFSTLSHKRHDFRENVIEYKMRVLIFSTTLSAVFIILRRTERDMTKDYNGLYVKYPLFLSDFNETRILTRDFRKILKHQIL
jgi:hypothetical protein